MLLFRRRRARFVSSSNSWPRGKEKSAKKQPKDGKARKISANRSLATNLFPRNNN